MSTGDMFPVAYLTEIINERDAARRRAAIDRLIHPGICHVSFDQPVYGRAAFERRVDRMVEVLPPATRASLHGEPLIDGDTVFFRWRVGAVSEEPVASGGAFVVLNDGVATWFYSTLNVEGHGASLGVE